MPHVPFEARLQLVIDSVVDALAVVLRGERAETVFKLLLIDKLKPASWMLAHRSLCDIHTGCGHISLIQATWPRGTKPAITAKMCLRAFRSLLSIPCHG